MADFAKQSFEFDIKIAADSIDKLRSIDVYRVLDSVDSDGRPALAAYIKGNRPDLADEVDDSLADLDNEDVSKTGSPAEDSVGGKGP